MGIIKKEMGVPPPGSIPLWLNPFALLKRLYDWVLSWAETRYAVPALFLVAFSESSFFPVPPDILILALALSVPARSFFYAGVALVGSVLGGMLGYLIGLEFMELIGWRILGFYGIEDRFTALQGLFRQYDAWVVTIAGFTPIPYKLFTIAGGACRINFAIFLIASTVGRAMRFYLVGGLIYLFGKPVKTFVERYFNLLTILFVVLFILGFAVFKWMV